MVIFVDDLGSADIGPFGATEQKTPNQDRMAAEGTKLTSFYAAPVCSVSRAQPLTGCYAARVSVPGVYIAAGPQGLRPNEITVAVAGTIDLLPTCVAVAGGKLPAEPEMGGRDLSPLLFGQSNTSPREAHDYFAGSTLQAVRQGRWKLAISPQNDAFDKTTADAPKTNPRLYDLAADVGETTNVAGKHPEVVTKLQALAETMNDEIGGAKPTARRPAGGVANPNPLYPFDEVPRRPRCDRRFATRPPAPRPGPVRLRPRRPARVAHPRRCPGARAPRPPAPRQLGVPTPGGEPARRLSRCRRTPPAHGGCLLDRAERGELPAVLVASPQSGLGGRRVLRASWTRKRVCRTGRSRTWRRIDSRPSPRSEVGQPRSAWESTTPCGAAFGLS